MMDEAMKGESFVVDRLETRQMVDDRQMSLFWLRFFFFFFFLNRIGHDLEERLERIFYEYIFFDLDLYMIKRYIYLSLLQRGFCRRLWKYYE